MSDYWFCCPNCGELAAVDEDQAEGRVSLQCPTEGCAFHETGFVRPKVETREPMHPEIAPSNLLTEEQRQEYDTLFPHKGVPTLPDFVRRRRAYHPSAELEEDA